MHILLIAHGFPPDALGGTEIYTHDLAEALRASGDEVSVLAREADPLRPDYDWRHDRQNGVDVYRVNYLFRDCTSFEGTYRNPRMRAVAGRLLNEIGADVAHFQHITCLTTDLVVECAQRGIPVFFTLNDYWLICQRGQLFDLDFRRCDGPHHGCTRCADAAMPPALYSLGPIMRRLGPLVPDKTVGAVRRVALGRHAKHNDSGPSEAMSRRMDHVRWIASHVNLFLAPSNTLRERFIDFAIPASQIRRVEQGIDHHRLAGQPTDERPDKPRTGPLKIGFLGSLMVSKAPHVLLEAFARLPKGVATLEVFGSPAAYHGDDSYMAQIEPLLIQPGVHRHGPIPHENIRQAFDAIDILVIPSVWLENAPFVIREAHVAGVPVVASNLGGMAEMVRHDVDGLLFDAGDAEDLRRTLQKLVDDPELLPSLRSRIPETETIEQDAARLRTLYLDPPPAPRRQPKLAAIVVNYRTPRETTLAVRSLTSSNRVVNDVIVVDNGSGDDSIDYLKQHLPATVRLATNQNNLGFSGGCNTGIRMALEAGAERVFLLNSDAMIASDTIARLEEAIESYPGTGIAGPVLLSAHDPGRIASAGMRFNRLTGRMRQIDSGEEWSPNDPKLTREVSAVSGCAMLVERSAFERAGLLDEDYFFSFEDLAFGIAVRQGGMKSVIVPDAIAYHLGSRSIGPSSPRRLYFAARNHLLAARRAAPVGALLALPRFVSIVALNLAHAFLAGGARTGGITAVMNGVRDHLSGRYGDPDGSRHPHA